MPIGTVTMILANVGMQIYNNWCNGRQNEQLQQMREEFEQAARERQTERMWQLMREGQELTMQLEEEKHQQRIDELKNDVGDLLLKLAYENAINNWPLNVLPIVMKNQALGNLLANQEESIALHCILAPSNCPDFNKYVYSAVEKELEQYCNLYWSSNSGHPILFYSGAWRGNDAPNGMQIESMQTALSNLPTLLITPFFRPSDGNLVIQLRIWGVGVASNDNSMLSDLYEFVPSEKEFQREYNKQLDFSSEDGLIEDLVEDLVPYLQCLIGYMADTYFWSSSGLAPLLPHLLMDGSINTDGMKYLISNSCDYYEKLLQTSKDNSENQPFAGNNLLKLYKGSAELFGDEYYKEILENYFVQYCNNHSNVTYTSFHDALGSYPFGYYDLDFINSYLAATNDPCVIHELEKIKNSIPINKDKDDIPENSSQIDDNDYIVLNEKNIKILTDLANKNNAIACYRLGEVYEFSIGTDYSPEEAEVLYKKSAELGFVLASIRNKFKNQQESKITESEVAFLQNTKSVQSTMFLALCCFKGIYMEASMEDAMEHLERVSESNHPYVYYLAAQFAKVRFGEEQGELIEELLRKSAELGYVEAQVELMNIYCEGVVVTENPNKCVDYAQKAALQGHPEALFTLAICYLRGYGVKINKSKAKELLELSANRGYEDALDILKSITK